MQQDPFLAPQEFFERHITFLSDYPLGMGGTGIIYYCKHNESNVEYALKKVYYNPFSLLTFKNECNILKQIFFLHNDVENPSLKFPEYIPYMEKYSSQGYLLMEYIKNESLFNQVSYSGRFQEEYVRKIGEQLFERLAHLHKFQIYHLDLKLDNILLDDNFKFKICDFGFANNPIGCTIGYASYEQKSHQIQNYQLGDVFSFGINLFILIMGIPPFQDYDDQWFKLIEKQEWDIFWFRFRTHRNYIPSKEFQNLFQQMVNYNVENRINMELIAQDDWFQKPKVQINELQQELRNRFNIQRQRQFYQM